MGVAVLSSFRNAGLSRCRQRRRQLFRNSGTISGKCPPPLLHSIVRNHPLVDGNKRLGLAATIAFYGVNGRRLTMTNDEAYEFVMSVASGDLDDVSAIAQRPESGSEDS